MAAERLLLLTLGLFASSSIAVPLAPRAVSYKQAKDVLSLKPAAAKSYQSSWALRASMAEGEADLATTGVSFLAEISFGSHTFLSDIDTGSSDTWTPESDFVCVDRTTGEQTTQDVCNFGSTYTPGYDFNEIPDENIELVYGDGSQVVGYLGTVPVTFAGIQVPSQEVGVITAAAFNAAGGGGIIGLAYPSATSAYPGDDPSTDVECSPGVTDCNQMNYSPLINTIFNVDKLTSPVFAIALSRDESGSGDGGVLTVGGTPDLSSLNASSKYATTPIIATPEYGKFRFYTINTDGLTGSWGSSGSFDYIVDTGTTLMYVPQAAADAINAAFDPPAVYSSNEGVYIVDCNAKAPTVGVTIGGQTLYINAADLVFSGGGDGTTCVSGITTAGNSLPFGILGDTFLKNVLAVFDVGNTQMSFGAREYYQS